MRYLIGCDCFLQSAEVDATVSLVACVMVPVTRHVSVNMIDMTVQDVVMKLRNVAVVERATGARRLMNWPLLRASKKLLWLKERKQERMLLRKKRNHS